MNPGACCVQTHVWAKSTPTWLIGTHFALTGDGPKGLLIIAPLDPDVGARAPRGEATVSWTLRGVKPPASCPCCSPVPFWGLGGPYLVNTPPHSHCVPLLKHLLSSLETAAPRSPLVVSIAVKVGRRSFKRLNLPGFGIPLRPEESVPFPKA